MAKFVASIGHSIAWTLGMLLDVSLLRRAKLENLERLAKAIGVALPRRKRDALYERQLVKAIAAKIQKDAMIDEFRRLTFLD